MNIGIIDAEIVGKSKHRFPNLCSMKISAWHKLQGDKVDLLLSYDNISQYDKVYISKVFIKTNIPNERNDMLKTEVNCIEFYKDHPILNLPNVEYGGTGFYYADAPNLPYEIEHIMPDYALYNDWIEQCIEQGIKSNEFKYYKDYSIGFLTRGCFRKCEFCVNRKYNSCQEHSPVYEFLEENRPKMCFLDDNFFACNNWNNIIEQIQELQKPFQFKQGLDERLITIEKAQKMAKWKYDGDFIFAFDNIKDKDKIVEKLDILNNYIGKRRKKFYVFCGFDRDAKYDNEFWERDIEELLERIYILKSKNALPYVMRHENYTNSPYKWIYIQLAAWANQPLLFKTFDFITFVKCKAMGTSYSKYKRDIEGYLQDGGKKNETWIALEEFCRTHKELCEKYFNLPLDKAPNIV